MMHVHGGTTDVTTYFSLRSSTDGTDLTAATITSIDLQYVRTGTAPVAKVDATALAATDSAHADNKAIEIDATDQPGLYRVDWPDAAFAAGVREVVLTVKYTGAFTEHLRVMIDPPVNIEMWNATDVPSEHTAGYPIVTIKDGTGTGEINTNAGAIALVDLVTTTSTATAVTTVNGLASGVITATAIAADAIGASELAADAATEIGTAVWASATRTLSALGFTLGAADLASDTITAAKIAADAITDAKVASDVTIASVTGAVGSVTGAVGSVTGNVGGNVTGTVGGFTTAAKAEIQTEAEDAIVAHRLDELLNADSDIDGAAPPTVGSVFHELMSKTAGSFTFDQTTDSNEALRDRGDAAWITGSTHAAADIWAVGTRTLTGLGFTLAASDLSADTITAAKVAADVGTEIGTAVWASATRTLTALGFTLAAGDLASGTITAAKFGAGAIDAAAIATGAIDADSLAADAVTEIWATALTEAYRGTGATGTAAQLLYEIIAHLGESSISSTTKTLKKLDGSTTAKTYTLDSATTPTAITEAT